MTRRVSKHGTTYTVGSSSTPAPDMPRVCCSCGERIKTSKEGFQHHVDDLTGGQWAWHNTCQPPWKQAS